MAKPRLKATVTSMDAYNQYKYVVAKNLTTLIKKRQSLKNTINELHNKITDNAEYIKNVIKIDLDKYDDYNDKTIDFGKALYNITLRRFNEAVANEVSIDLPFRGLCRDIMDYCNALDIDYRNEELIKKFNAASKINGHQHRRIIGRYYKMVGTIALDGYAYKFSNGIGEYAIEYVIFNKDNAPTMIDFKETNRRKKELLAAGEELFDRAKFEWCKLRNIPYNGVDYRVFYNKPGIFKHRMRGNKVKYTFNKLFTIAPEFNTKEKYQAYVDSVTDFNELINDTRLSSSYKTGIIREKFPLKALELSIDYAEQQIRSN